MKFKLVAFLCLFATGVFAQDCSCTDDLNEAEKAIQVSFSYKDLIKEKGQDHFTAELNKIKELAKADPNPKNCTVYIERLLRIMNDKHLVLHDDYTRYVFKSKEDYQKFKTTAQYTSTPVYDLDSKPSSTVNDSILGTYQSVFKYYTIEMVPDPSRKDRFLGVISKTTAALWDRGQVKFILDKTADNTYEGIYYDDVHFARYVKTGYKNGILLRGEWVKEKVLETMPYNPYVVPSNPFTYKKLSDDVDYLYLGTFYGGYAHRADTFYNATIPKLKAKKLIIDVRNNTGGGQRCYEQLLKHLKSSENTAEEIAIIQNKNCVSACEHFISWFSKNDMATTYGENTSGMLAYGYGNRSSIMKKLTCTGTTLEITETKYPQYKEFEFIGLEPKVFLDRKTDWIQQVQKVLEK